MPSTLPRNARRAALLAAALTALAAPAAASAAKPANVDLRVEAGGQALVPGLTYHSGSNTVATSEAKPACNGTGAKKKIGTSTALGTLVAASDSRASLRPLRISDQFDFGLLVCGVGSFTGGSSGFWLYKVNHRAPQVAAEQRKVRSGDEVLWYYSNATSGANTGSELAIEAPTRARAGKPFRARVWAYDANGKRTPAAGATVRLGSKVARADVNGRVGVTLSGTGILKLRATRNNDIPSGFQPVCFARKLSTCPARGTRTLYGTAKADKLRGTEANDRIRAGLGKDTIDVRGGGTDVVNCGKGKDTVKLGSTDRALGCERVSRSKKRK